jgi:hypothetical protein
LLPVSTYRLAQAQHSESVDLAHPGQDENTITTKLLVQFIS